MRRPFPDPTHKRAQVQALEKGIEPELVTERISELREGKKALEQALTELGAEREEAEAEELSAQLARVPDLTKALREAAPEVQRQVFQAFELEILYDKAGRTIEISPPSRRRWRMLSRSRKPSRRRAHWW